MSISTIAAETVIIARELPIIDFTSWSAESMEKFDRASLVEAAAETLTLVDALDRREEFFTVESTAVLEPTA